MIYPLNLTFALTACFISLASPFSAKCAILADSCLTLSPFYSRSSASPRSYTSSGSADRSCKAITSLLLGSMFKRYSLAEWAMGLAIFLFACCFLAVSSLCFWEAFLPRSWVDCVLYLTRYLCSRRAFFRADVSIANRDFCLDHLPVIGSFVNSGMASCAKLQYC